MFIDGCVIMCVWQLNLELILVKRRILWKHLKVKFYSRPSFEYLTNFSRADFALPLHNRYGKGN